jgi:diguanylate cyclase (GGDEF)-like protein
MRPRNATALAVLIGLLFTVVTAVAAPIALAYRSVPAKIALDTAEALIAFLTAFLIYGRLRLGAQRREALLVYALLVFGGSNLVFGVLPKVFPAMDSQATLVWAPLTARMIAAATMAVAAFSSAPSELGQKGRGWMIGGAAAGTLTAVWGCAALFAGVVPTGIPAQLTLDPAHPHVVGHPALLGAQLVVFALFAAAAVGFTVRAEATKDGMLAWLGAGAALGALARLNYFLFPSIYTEYVYTGDLLRLGFYLLLLCGSALEILGYWRRMQEMAVVDRVTGLNNRHGFETLAELQLKTARRTGRSAAAVFIDLNDMKGINDRFGHEAGDQALTDTAEVLRRTFRDVDVLGRVGGDEFCVLLVDVSDPSVVASRLQEELERYRDERPRAYHLSLSAGVAVAGDDEPLESLVRRADEEMYRDKIAGKGPDL